jgi:hypothetical protein
VKTLAALVGVLALSACATTDSGGVCGPGSEPRGTAELYFGRNIADSPGVSDADWRAFVDEEVTPLFPDGLTAIDAAGQWRGESGSIGREASKVLVIVLSGRTDDRARLDAVRDAYKRRFRQEAVMLVERRACVTF